MKKRFFAGLLVLALVCGMWQGAHAFSDTDKHWAKAYVDKLVELKAIKGYDDGTFKPDSAITRAEFAAILLRALGNDPGQPETGKWYELYMKEAADKGYVKQGEFDDVNKNITRGEMARIIARAMNETYPENMADYSKLIKDYSRIPNEYKEHVLKAFVKGVITGKPDGTFGYGGTATRAEACAMIVRLIDKNERKEPVLVVKGKELDAIVKLLTNAGRLTDNFVGYNSEKKVTSFYDEMDFFISKDEDEDLYDYYGDITIYNYKDTTLQAFKTVLKVYFPNEYETVYKKLLTVVKDKIGPLGVADYAGYHDNRYIDMKKYDNGIGIVLGKEGVKYK